MCDHKSQNWHRREANKKISHRDKITKKKMHEGSDRIKYQTLDLKSEDTDNGPCW